MNGYDLSIQMHKKHQEYLSAQRELEIKRVALNEICELILDGIDVTTQIRKQAVELRDETQKQPSIFE